MDRWLVVFTDGTVECSAKDREEAQEVAIALCEDVQGYSTEVVSVQRQWTLTRGGNE